MPFDPDRYHTHLDAFELTEAQSLDLIRTVHSIMESFVDTAFGVHPVQTCLALQKQTISKSPSEIVSLSHENIKEEFQTAASSRQKD